jgi:pyruvate dehydrogenase E2 component (dihydrolipoamide acetyltransferase)
MPKFGLTMQEGTIVRWLKNEGDPVAEGETLVEIETEKIVCEVESPAAGTLDKICAAPGTVVPAGETIGAISRTSEQMERFGTSHPL